MLLHQLSTSLVVAITTAAGYSAIGSGVGVTTGQSTMTT